MTKYQTIDYTVSQGVARIVFNRPPANVLDGQMAKDLFEAVDASEKDDSAKVRYLTGNGKYFSLGLDLKTVNLNRTPEIVFWIHEYLNPTICTLIQSPKPTVCAVNGPAVGAGASLALAADIIYTSSEAYFGFPFVEIGLIPDLLVSYTLQRALGYNRASSILLGGDTVTAVRAESYGLVSGVFDSSILERLILVEVLNLAKLDPISLAATKKVLSSGIDLLSQCRLEEELQSQLLMGKTFKKAVNAFKKG